MFSWHIIPRRGPGIKFTYKINCAFFRGDGYVAPDMLFRNAILLVTRAGHAEKFVFGNARGFNYLGYCLAGWPTRLTICRAAFAFVKRSCIHAASPGQGGWRQSHNFCNFIHGGPNAGMSHVSLLWFLILGIKSRNAVNNITAPTNRCRSKNS